FWFTLPLAPEGKAPEEYDSLEDDAWQVDPEGVHKDIMEVFTGETDSGKGKTEAGFRLLVVDDDPVCLRLYSIQLADSGYLITQAVNGKQALEKIKEADDAGDLFDLVLLDVVMPNMSGHEVCRILRKKYSPDRLPVLMLTAKDRVEDRVAGLDAGANDYLAKPFSRHELKARIHTHVSLKKSVEERKKLETQLRRAQKVEAMGTMAGGFAHDFNNILGIILGNTELALEDVPKSNPAKFNLEEVRIACMRAKDVVSQIHSFASRIEGKMKPVRITAIVRESVKMLRVSIPATIDINLDVTAENDMIMADPARIHQMTVNLVNNAAFEMRETGGILNIGIENVVIDRYEVAVYDDISPGKYVRLTVRDTGNGIDPETMDRIFDPY
ncbi:MAG: response regulator, partial [Desulfobulbaceae bacterium]|nr:response regulator [Desulfobulbaceae bacterium]